MCVDVHMCRLKPTTQVMQDKLCKRIPACYRSGPNVPRLNIQLLSETRRLKTNKSINILLRGSLKIFHYSPKRPRVGAKGCSLLVTNLTRPGMRFQT